MDRGKIVAATVIRGQIITESLAEFGGRGGEDTFLSPDPETIRERLPLGNPGRLRDLAAVPFAEIADYLVALGTRLSISENVQMREAMEQSVRFSDATAPIVRRSYETLHSLFNKASIYEAANLCIGLDCLDGWREITLAGGGKASIRAFGARALHIVAGNSPLISAMSILRNAITRSDAIIKTPSNDPLTAVAIARTMVQMAPEHPITRHLSVAYWKGGDSAFEERLYQPANIEKILAWGGFASVKHVTRYIQPGLELISLDPKRSATIIGPEAFADERLMRVAAARTAMDIGAINQLGCVNARVVYVVTGTDDSGVRAANRFAALVFDEIQRLPEGVSTPAKRIDPDLRAHIDALRSSEDFYTVIGARTNEGGIIVSHMDEPVDFYPSLNGRIANIVPIDSELDAVRFMNSYTQTVGIFPETLKERLRDVLPLHGAQRLVSLGYATAVNGALPQDAIEPVRRMVKWIVDESYAANATPSSSGPSL